MMEEQQALSRVFIKIIATKVNAAHSRLNVDSFWDIVPSPLSDIPASIKHYLINANALTEIKKMVREQVTPGTGYIKVATLNIRNHEKWESEGDEW